MPKEKKQTTKTRKFHSKKKIIQPLKRGIIPSTNLELLQKSRSATQEAVEPKAHMPALNENESVKTLPDFPGSDISQEFELLKPDEKQPTFSGSKISKKFLQIPSLKNKPTFTLISALRKISLKHLLLCILLGLVGIGAVVFMTLKVMHITDIQKRAEKYVEMGNYPAALEEYAVLHREIPLWFISNKEQEVKTLLDSSAQYQQGIADFNQGLYDAATDHFNNVIKQDIYYAAAQQKLTEIINIKIFKKAQDELADENRNKPAEPDPIDVPDRDSPFEPGNNENPAEPPAEQPNETEDQQPPSDQPDDEPLEDPQDDNPPVVDKIDRPYQMQFFDCSTSDYSNVNEEQITTFYQTLDYMKFPKNLLTNAVIVFNTEILYYSTRSSHTVQVDGKNYTFPLLDPEQYQYSTSWNEGGRVFINLYYRYKGSDLAAIVGFELAHVLEDLGKVSLSQITEWSNIRGIPSSLLADWNKKTINIDEWEMSPREDFAECFKAILGDNKGGDLWQIKTKYGSPSQAQREWMKKYQTSFL